MHLTYQALREQSGLQIRNTEGKMRLRREEGPQGCRGPEGREGGSQWDDTDRGCRRRESEMGDLM